MEICVDFDGTCVTHDFPKIGKDIGAVPVLKRLIESGHKIILFTMRSDKILPYGETTNYLTEAIEWFKENGVPLYGINENPDQKFWTDSPKAYGQMYIDDAALGCPCTYDTNISNEPFVDWVKVEKYLEQYNIFKKPLI